MTSRIELRHTRQAKLREVGADGSARVRSAKVRVEADGTAATIAARYLAGAGVGEIIVGSERARDAAIEVDARVKVTLDASCLVDVARFGDLDPAAREVAVGAAVALDALRRLVLAEK